MVIVCNVIMYNSSLCACMIHSFGIIIHVQLAVRVLILQHNDDDYYYQKMMVLLIIIMKEEEEDLKKRNATNKLF